MKLENKTSFANIETKHPLYNKRASQWEIVRDCVEGSDAVKAKRQQYLPRPCSNNALEAEMRYNAFLSRAVFVNFTGQTLEGVHGMVMRRTPTIDADDLFKASGYLDNVDGKGTSLYQFISDALYDSMQTCFGGVLVDMPVARDGMTKAEAEAEGIRPYLRYYKAEDIINWRFREDNIGEYSLVVLKEHINVAKDPFSYEDGTRYRVLALSDSNEYFQILVTKNVSKHGKDEYSYEVININVNNEPLDYIPFVSMPYREPEKPMLLDLAVTNIGHFQKSADYEYGVHMTTLPTGYVTGHKDPYDPDDPESRPEELVLGDDIFLMFEEAEAKVGTLAFAGEGLSHSENAIKQAEAQMTVMGSRIMSPDKNMSETAESAYVHRAGENAKLATFARNVASRFSTAITWMSQWSGFDGPVKVSLNIDYETMGLDPNVVNSLANLSSQGKFPLLCVFYVLRQQEIIDPNMTFEDYIFLLEQEDAGLSPAETYGSFQKYLADNKRTVTGV